MKTTRRAIFFQRKGTFTNVAALLSAAFLCAAFVYFCENSLAAGEGLFSTAALESARSENVDLTDWQGDVRPSNADDSSVASNARGIGLEVANDGVSETSSAKRSSERVFFTKLGSEGAGFVPSTRSERWFNAESNENSAEGSPNFGGAAQSESNDARVSSTRAKNFDKTPILANDSGSSGGGVENGLADASLKSEKTGKTSFLGALITGVGALSLVLGVFFALVFLLKLLTPNKFDGSSDAAVLVDSCFVGRKFELLTLRWGNKLILAARTSDNKISRLAETSDPEEIAGILDVAARRKKNVGDVASRWKEALKSIKAFKTAKIGVVGLVLSNVLVSFAGAMGDGVAFGQENGTSIPAATKTSLSSSKNASNSGAATLGVGPSELGFSDASTLNPTLTPTEKNALPAVSSATESNPNVAQTAADFEKNVEKTNAAANIIGQTSTNGNSAENVKKAGAESSASQNDSKNAASNFLANGPGVLSGANGWLGPDGISSSLKTIVTLSILTLAPAILLMTTSFVRLSVVLALLRQAIGAGQVPSNQVTTALAIFLTLLIMAPVWTDAYEEAVVPYSNGEISDVEAFQRGQAPIRTFLWKQIEKTGNVDAIWLFMRYIPDAETPQFYEDVPWRALAPAFLLSELKTAFLIGFQIFIPFLVVDVVVSCVLVSTGMMMLPPAVVSLPFKLAIFVLTDGWTLIVKSLLESFAWGVGS